ncbi:phosphate transport system protein [Advenella incenata]|jgi:phosphate transport system protein|uniref:Phosphate-specific transport system accessory protein PhoU n=1 Tax=Advenella incenata TaxID=267800 RepID=A0A4Q7VDW9_9BURK|nr:phosphate signaling complex protein PhoU [Advenella incenata]RZT93108.1 phosphate transport system protein [Advenella incenata]
MAQHTNTRFDAELEDIRSRFLRMGGLVEAMIEDSMLILADGNLTVAERVFEREKEVNRLEMDIDHSIAQILALQQPTAVDLRLVISVSKMLTDMERSGDEAEKIAKMARRLYESPNRYEPIVDMTHFAVGVQKMLNRSLDAFARKDAILAADVVRSDKKIDKQWKSILREVSSYMIEDPRTTTACIDLIFIARALERIGDHAKNMAERVIYLVQGEDARHTSVKNVESMARGDEEPPAPPASAEVSNQGN